MNQSTFDFNDLISTGEQSLPMACGERPQERLENFGVAALSDTELVATILQGNGTRAEDAVAVASRVIAEAGSIAGLAAWHPTDYRRVKGIGRSKGLQLSAIAEIARRMMKAPGTLNMVCNRADAIAAMFWPMVAGLQVEKFWVLCLSRKNRLIKTVEVTSGTATAALAHPREVFREALRHGATAIVCVHNLCAAPHRLCYVTSRAMWSAVAVCSRDSRGERAGSLHIAKSVARSFWVLLWWPSAFHLSRLA